MKLDEFYKLDDEYRAKDSTREEDDDYMNIAWEMMPLLRAALKEAEAREQDNGAFMAYMREVLDSLPCKHGAGQHLGTNTAPMMWPEAIGCALAKAREKAEAERDALREKVKRLLAYVEHACVQSPGREVCDCGLAALLKEEG